MCVCVYRRLGKARQKKERVQELNSTRRVQNIWAKQQETRDITNLQNSETVGESDSGDHHHQDLSECRHVEGSPGADVRNEGLATFIPPKHIVVCCTWWFMWHRWGWNTFTVVTFIVLSCVEVPCTKPCAQFPTLSHLHVTSLTFHHLHWRYTLNKMSHLRRVVQSSVHLAAGASDEWLWTVSYETSPALPDCCILSRYQKLVVKRSLFCVLPLSNATSDWHRLWNSIYSEICMTVISNVVFCIFKCCISFLCVFFIFQSSSKAV